MSLRAEKYASIKQSVWLASPARIAERLEEGRFNRFPYIDLVSDHIALSILNGNGRIIVSLPPRHGKSTLISKWTPAWTLTHFPCKRIILVSYESEFAASWGRQARNLIEIHSQKLGIEVSSDSHSADRWDLVTGGGMFTAGMGGSITGRGGDLILIDDPLKNDEVAYSQRQREKQIEWFNHTLYTRAEPGATIIVLMTRWHEGDLAGYLLSDHTDNWTEIRLPALAEDDDPMGRKPGEALCPERYDAESLLKIKSAVGPTVWSALYQQSPTPPSGGFFERQMFAFAPLPKEGFRYTFITGDTAYKEKQENDFTVLAAWGWDGASPWLIDVYRQRIKAADLEGPCISFIANNMKWGFRGVYIEPKGHGIYLNQALPKRGVLMPSEKKIEEFFSDRKLDKQERASNAVPHLTTRKVYFNQDIHIKDELLAEVLAFPKGKHDDFVDCLVDACKMVFPNNAPGILGVMMQNKGR